MKKALIFILFTCLVGPNFAFGASIYPGPYILAGAGISKPTKSLLNKPNSSTNITFAASPVFNFSAGYKVNRFFRGDINAQYRPVRLTQRTFKSVKMKSYSASVNAYLEADLRFNLIPYLTVGCGIGNINLNDKSKINLARNSHSMRMTSNAGAGMQFQLNHSAALDIGYRYIDLGKIKAHPNTLTNPPSTFPKKLSLGLHEVLVNVMLLL